MPKKEDPRKVWAAEEAKKAQAQAKAIQEAPSPAYDVIEGSDVEVARNDWDALVTIARIKFPDHLAIKYNLTPNERRACIAFKIGWTHAKIAAAAHRDVSTVGRWLAKPEAIEFCRAFEYHNALADNKEVIDREVFASLQVLKDLRDSPVTSPQTRASIAQWFIEQKYGKAKESKEVKGISLRELTEQLRSTEAVDTLIDLTNTPTDSKKPAN